MDLLSPERVVGARGWTKEPWKSRYPRFALVMEDDGPFGRYWPIRCDVRGNVFCDTIKGDRTIWSRVAPEARAKTAIGGDTAVELDVFVDPARLNFSFKEKLSGEAAAASKIPFDTIGLTLDAYRSEMPSKDAYRAAIQEHFRGIPCMPATRKRIDTAALLSNVPRTKLLPK